MSKEYKYEQINKVMNKECINIHENIKEKLMNFIKNEQVPNILLHGPSGGGKRTLVKEFINKLYTDQQNDLVMYVECGHGKGIKFIRDEVNYFAKTNCFGISFKTIVLLNADKLTIDAQSALRRSIELFCKTTRFIIIIHEKSKLLKPLVSRFCEIFVPLPNVNDKLINLHTNNKSDAFSERENKKIQTLKEILSKISNKYQAEDYFKLTEELYMKGYTGIHFIEYMLKSNYSAKDILCVEQFKNHIKSEKLLIFCILIKSINTFDKSY